MTISVTMTCDTCGTKTTSISDERGMIKFISCTCLSKRAISYDDIELYFGKEKARLFMDWKANTSSGDGPV